MTEIRLPPFETAVLLVKDKMRTAESMIFSLSSLRRIVDTAITPWPYDGTRPRSSKIIEKLISDQAIQHLILKSPRYPNISRYAFGSFSKLALATCLKPKAYLSHWSAADVHGLTTKSAPTIYVNKEQSPKPPPKGSLSQSAIDRAFANKQRTSNYIFKLDRQSFTLLNGKHTGNYGVESLSIDGRAIRVTNIPRTLIDITVRPSYAGGIGRVIDVFKAAQGKVEVEELLKTLQHVNHKYPFHQALGYYLKVAGFSKSQLKPLSDLGLKHKFFLDYGMTNPAFDAIWQVYVPG